MKLKHNKKRNTAFLYESLLKELAKTVAYNKATEKNTIVSIIQKYFKKGTILAEELELYKAISETQRVDVYTAERLITETKRKYETFDKKRIFNEQTSLINTINKRVGKHTFGNFVSNYRYLATISQMFSSEPSVKERVLLERKLIGSMVAKPSQSDKAKAMPHVDNLVFKTVVENFNKKYNGKLLEEQKELLNNYILSFNDSGVEFKVYMNETIGHLKGEVGQLFGNEEISQDQELTEKLKQVKETLLKFQTKRISEPMLEKVMQIQALVKECSE